MTVSYESSYYDVINLACVIYSCLRDIFGHICAFLWTYLTWKTHSCGPTGCGETPTLETIDSYMKKLHSIIVSNPQEHENLINNVREVVNRLDR